MEEQQPAKEMYEKKKAEREVKKEDERNRSRDAARADLGARGAKTAGWIFLIVIIIGSGIYFAIQNKEPLGEDFSVKYENQGREHVPVGTVVEYNSNPPSSGSHYPNPARTGFYDEPIADGALVHNLEHGEIWIAYRPNVSEEIKASLKKFAGQYIIVTPREANDTDISVVAWTHVDAFDTTGATLTENEKKRIRDFIKRYDNKGPENLRGVQHGRI